jgi:hypothetical protein
MGKTRSILGSFGMKLGVSERDSPTNHYKDEVAYGFLITYKSFPW